MKLEFSSTMNLPEEKVRKWAETGIAPQINLNADDYQAMYAACVKWVKEHPAFPVGTIVRSMHANENWHGLHVYEGNGGFRNLSTLGPLDHSSTLMHQSEIVWRPDR